MEKSSQATGPEALRLSRNGWVLNNEPLPVLLYRGVLDLRNADPAAACEALFSSQWMAGAVARRRL